MRPLMLSLRSFGPFAGEERVDFTRYGDNAFLLIHGVTGAGKTTILDGICYALYGDASGEKRDEHFLRSQLAPPDLLCQVEFHFQVGPNRFQIRRTPPQKLIQKGKERKISHQVEFCQVDERGEIIGDRLTKVGEVEKRVEEVIGFSSSQFRQVVVLPQGEFRRLLLAKSDEKEEILEKLFGTERYKLVEELLKKRRATLAGELKELKAAVEGILASKGVNSREELAGRVAAIGEERVKLAEAISGQEKLQKEAQERLQAAQSIAARFAELEEAGSAHSLLEKRKPEMERNRARAELARKALGLSDIVDLVNRAERELFTQTDQLSRLETDITVLESDRLQALERSKEAKANSDRVPGLTAERAVLQTRLEKVRELAACTSALVKAAKAEKQESTAVEKAAKEIEHNESRFSALTGRIEALSLSVGVIGQIEQELEKVRGLHAGRSSLDRDMAELADLTVKIATAARESEQAQALKFQAEEEYDDLHERFIRGQAALLSGGLVEGQPCPVCGSPDHPSPASSHEEVPSDKELDKARKQIAESQKKLQASEKALNELLSRKSALEGGIAGIRATLGIDGEIGLEEIAARERELLERRTSATAGAEELTAAREERERLGESLAMLKAELLKAGERLAAATAEHQRHKAVEAKLVAETGGDSSDAINSRLAEIDGFIETAGRELVRVETELRSVDDRLSGMKGQREEKKASIPRQEAELKKLRSDCARRMAAEGFKDEMECSAALLPLEEIERLKIEVERFSHSLSAAAERSGRAADACRGLTKPDMNAVTAARDEADRRMGELRKEDGILEGEQRGLDEALRTIGEREARVTLLDREYAVAGRLAEITGGQNKKRMTLQRFVLAALFEEVAMAASQRLTRMSRGRYHLVRSEAPRDNKATSGLDLDVTDDYIGEKRPAFTLSGGESFLASLSLALGLSDVVMAQCGGRYLDCIFIDEGFGSLDGETLDFALNTLIELHRTGRVIGIISHVSELKERIPSRIEVVSSKDGSRIMQQDA